MPLTPPLRGVLGAAALSLAAALPAAAGTVSLAATGPGSFGTPNWSAPVDLDTPRDISVDAGPFRVTDGVRNLLAWCIEVAQSFNQDSTEYDTHATLISAQQENLLDRLFTQFLANVTDGTTGAAMQVAIWEVIYDGDDASPILDVATGTFTAQSSAAVDLAGSWLGTIASDTTAGDYVFTTYENADFQNLLSAAPAPIPLPAAGWLLVAGFGGLVALRRRAA